MAQYSVPDSTVSNTGSWTSTGANLWSVIDETSANDADYITSPDAPANAECLLGMTDITDPTTDEGFVLVFRAAQAAGWLGSPGQEQEDLTVILYCGATPIATRTITNLQTKTTYTRALTAAEVALITDFTDLQVLIRANESVPDSGTNGVRVGMLYLMAPPFPPDEHDAITHPYVVHFNQKVHTFDDGYE